MPVEHTLAVGGVSAFLLSQILDLIRVLATGGVATAVVVQVGQYLRERLRGRNRVKEIEAERDAEIAKIEAARDAEIAKIHAQGVVQVQLERERNHALTSSTLSIGLRPDDAPHACPAVIHR